MAKGADILELRHYQIKTGRRENRHVPWQEAYEKVTDQTLKQEEW